MKYLVWFVILATTSRSKQEDLFGLDIYHVNDFHARFEPVDRTGLTCRTGKCFGGFSRLYDIITKSKKQNPDLILLNAGDNFQGTIWYNIYKWNVTQHFLNKLPFDAYTLGNHEFDDNIKGVVPFIKSLKAPVVVSNIDDNLEPEIQGIYSKSKIIWRQGKKIGLIGVTTQFASEKSNSGKLIFLDESVSVNKEAERLVKEEDVFTNIVISHCGYTAEKEIARKSTGKISVVVGAHSHSYLQTGDTNFGVDVIEGPYPTVIKNGNGDNVLVTQAGSFSKYLGNISVYYDNTGKVRKWDGSPIFLNTSFPQDDEINKEIDAVKIEIEKRSSRVIGQSLVEMKKSCKKGECLLGNFICDAMVYSYLDLAEEGYWTYAGIALFNAGGLRSNIYAGNITYEDIETCQPFKNTFDVSEIEGKYIKDIFEFVALPLSFEGEYSNEYINMLQVGGVQVVLNLMKPKGSRVESLKVVCINCSVPIYEDIKMDKTYRIITPSFLTNGGDGFKAISINIRNTKLGTTADTDILESYLAVRNPYFQEISGRIQIIR